MAIVKATYTKSREGAKASIRYMEQRPGKDRAKITRSLFGIDGVMDREQAYRFIDKAGEGSVFYRFILSPDPKREDTKRDLHMRGITEQTMQRLNTLLNQEVTWVAAEHADHAPHRHVHIVASVPGKLTVEDFEALRLSATESALFQRKERDLARGTKRGRFIQSRSYKTYSAGRELAGGRPAANIQICPRCRYGQSVRKSKQNRLYRCPTCGLKLIHDLRIGLTIKEAKWG